VITAKVLKSNREVLRRNTFRHVRQEEFDTGDRVELCSEFNVSVSQRLGDPMNMEKLKPECDVARVTLEYKVYDDDDSRAMPTIEIIDLVATDKYYPDIFNSYIAAQVLFPRGDKFRLGTVLRR
jgi:hypothetical protein